MWEFTFRCPNFKTKETITIVHGTGSGDADTFVVDGIGTRFAEVPPIAESLIINCDNYYPWDVHGPGQAVGLDGIVDLPNDILGVIQHFGQNKPTPEPDP